MLHSEIFGGPVIFGGGLAFLFCSTLSRIESGAGCNLLYQACPAFSAFFLDDPSNSRMRGIKSPDPGFSVSTGHIGVMGIITNHLHLIASLYHGTGLSLPLNRLTFESLHLIDLLSI